MSGESKKLKRLDREVQLVQSADILRDCRKSPKVANLTISHVMKSITYTHQIYRFRVFRRSLRISKL